MEDVRVTPPPEPPQEELPPPEPSGRGVTIAFSALVAVGLIVAAIYLREAAVSASHYVLLSLLLFTTGAVGVLVRRNALVLFMCIELMLNAANLAFVTFARVHGRADGHVAVLFVMIVAAAEVTVGLAIIVTIFRRRLSASVDEASLLKW